MDTQILTPWALLAIEDTEGVRWAGQACGGHRQGSVGHGGAMMCPLCSVLAAFSLQIGTMWVTAQGKDPPRGSLETYGMLVPGE